MNKALLAAATVIATPVMVQAQTWHFVAVDGYDEDQVAWFVSDQIRDHAPNDKRIAIALVMRESAEYLYEIPEGGWVLYNLAYDCAGYRAGTVSISKMTEGGRIDSTDEKEELEMRDMYAQDDGKYFEFVCNGARPNTSTALNDTIVRVGRRILKEEASIDSDW